MFETRGKQLYRKVQKILEIPLEDLYNVNDIPKIPYVFLALGIQLFSPRLDILIKYVKFLKKNT